MGLFISLSGIINKTEKEVTDALKDYLKTVEGHLEAADIDSEHENFCVIQEAEGNTTVFYPAHFLKGNECASFLSKALNAAVFMLDIHDGDFWWYTLFFDGEIKDQFMPIPDYFDENLSKKEIESWQGDAQVVTEYVPGLKKEEIEKYLTRWDLEQDETKAYEDDEFTNCEWQLTDFMKKLKLAYPIDNAGTPIGNVYKFWSKDIPLTDVPVNEFVTSVKTSKTIDKPWWKFW